MEIQALMISFNCMFSAHQINFCQGKTIELPKYYVRLQTAVARNLGLPVSRLVGRHTNAATKHLLLFQFPSGWSRA